MTLLPFIPPVVFGQLILHLTYSMLLDCLLGWKISKLFQDTKTCTPPQFQQGWSWQKPEINSIYRNIFSSALTEHRYLGRSRPCFHLSCAFVTSFLCPQRGGQKDTLYSALTRATAPWSLRQLPGVTHIVLAIKEVGTPNSKVSLENWEFHMNTTCGFEPVQRRNTSLSYLYMQLMKPW